ncbi:MAG: hypothetical protein JWO53_209 [Chlamydiia bacterium]|nr:hypothetical protein [Chlamydiia bacterium]
MVSVGSSRSSVDSFNDFELVDNPQKELEAPWINVVCANKFFVFTMLEQKQAMEESTPIRYVSRLEKLYAQAIQFIETRPQILRHLKKSDLGATVVEKRDKAPMIKQVAQKVMQRIPVAFNNFLCKRQLQRSATKLGA